MKGKTHIIAKLHRTDLLISSHSGERKTPSCSQIKMVKVLLVLGGGTGID